MSESNDVLAVRLKNLEDDVRENRQRFDNFLEKDHRPLTLKVDSFVNFQKLLTMLWTGLVFVGGLVVGSSGWFKR